MLYLDFRTAFKEYPLFSVDEVRKVFPHFDTRRLFEWCQKDYLKKIRNKWYCFSDTEINEKYLFHVANKIYGPSYISCETALSFYNLIPEAVFTITSVTSQKTMEFHTALANFTYRHIKPSLLFGYKLVNNGVSQIKIADIEKAIIDYLYLNPRYNEPEDFSGLRINTKELAEQINSERIRAYLKEIRSSSLSHRVDSFLNQNKHAES